MDAEHRHVRGTGIEVCLASQQSMSTMPHSYSPLAPCPVLTLTWRWLMPLAKMIIIMIIINQGLFRTSRSQRWPGKDTQTSFPPFFLSLSPSLSLPSPPPFFLVSLTGLNLGPAERAMHYPAITTSIYITPSITITYSPPPAFTPPASPKWSFLEAAPYFLVE